MSAQPTAFFHMCVMSPVCAETLFFYQFFFICSYPIFLTMAAAAPAAAAGTGKTVEHNYVSDAHNFEQRIKVENEAAQVS